MPPKAPGHQQAAGGPPTPLHIAAARHDFLEAEHLLAAGADLEASNQIRGFTPLLAAILRRPEDLNKKLSPSLWADAWDDPTSMLRHLCLLKQDEEDPPSTIKMVDLLLDHKADPRATAASGVTALHLAAAVGSISVVQRLLKRKLDPNAQVKDKGRCPSFGPLHLAAMQGNLEVVDVLLAAGAQVNLGVKGVGTPLTCAVMGWNDVVCRRLIAVGAAVTGEQFRVSCELWGTGLETPVNVHEMMAVWRAPLIALADVTWVPHWCGCKVKEQSAQGAVLQALADMVVIEHSQSPALTSHLIDALVSIGADINHHGIDHLHQLIGQNAVEYVQAVLSQPVMAYFTPLMAAVVMGRTEMVSKLVAFHAKDLEIAETCPFKAFIGARALDLAVCYTRREAVFRLVRAGYTWGSQEPKSMFGAWVSYNSWARGGRQQLEDELGEWVKSVAHHRAQQEGDKVAEDMWAEVASRATLASQPLISSGGGEDLIPLSFYRDHPVTVRARNPPRTFTLAEVTKHFDAVSLSMKGPRARAADAVSSKGEEEDASEEDLGKYFGDEDSRGWTDLHWAATSKDDADVEEMLLEDWDPNQHHTITPLMLACMGDLDCEADEDRDLLEDAAFTSLLADLLPRAGPGDCDTAKLLLEAGADRRRHHNGFTALHLAAACGPSELVELLVDVEPPKARKAMLDEARSFGGYTPLLTAAHMGQAGAVAALLKAGCDVNEGHRETGETALHLAARAKHVEVVSVLLEHKAWPNERSVVAGNHTPLHEAISLSKDKARVQEPLSEVVVKQLVEAGANIEARDSRYDSTALLTAVSSNNTLATKVLLGAGADLTAVDDQGRNAVLLAASWGNLDAVLMLIDAGCEVGPATLKSTVQYVTNAVGSTYKASTVEGRIKLALKLRSKKKHGKQQQQKQQEARSSTPEAAEAAAAQLLAEEEERAAAAEAKAAKKRAKQQAQAAAKQAAAAAAEAAAKAEADARAEAEAKAAAEARAAAAEAARQAAEEAHMLAAQGVLEAQAKVKQKKAKNKQKQQPEEQQASLVGDLQAQQQQQKQQKLRLGEQQQKQKIPLREQKQQQQLPSAPKASFKAAAAATGARLDGSQAAEPSTSGAAVGGSGARQAEDLPLSAASAAVVPSPHLPLPVIARAAAAAPPAAVAVPSAVQVAPAAVQVAPARHAAQPAAVAAAAGPLAPPVSTLAAAVPVPYPSPAAAAGVYHVASPIPWPTAVAEVTASQPPAAAAPNGPALPLPGIAALFLGRDSGTSQKAGAGANTGPSPGAVKGVLGGLPQLPLAAPWLPAVAGPAPAVAAGGGGLGPPVGGPGLWHLMYGAQPHQQQQQSGAPQQQQQQLGALQQQQQQQFGVLQQQQQQQFGVPQQHQPQQQQQQFGAPNHQQQHQQLLPPLLDLQGGAMTFPGVATPVGGLQGSPAVAAAAMIAPQMAAPPVTTAAAAAPPGASSIAAGQGGVGESKRKKGGQKECVVCWEERPSVMLFPCKHLVLCEGCSEALQRSNADCPMCRATVEQHIVVKRS